MPVKVWSPFENPHQIRRSARYKELDKLHRIYYGKQYEDRKHGWWPEKDRSNEHVPLMERKPCRVYKLPGAAVRQVVRFLFGDERWPTVKLEPDQLSDDDATTVQTWLGNVIEKCSLKIAQRELAAKALSVGTAAAALFVNRGFFSVEVLRAQDCWPKFEDDDSSAPVEQLVQCYEFSKDTDDGSGIPRQQRFLFRREWLPTGVLVYPDYDLTGGEDKPKWEAPTLTESGVSFTPVLWIRNCGKDTKSLDGESLYANSEKDIEALDFTASQRYRGIAYLGTPQPVETGAENESTTRPFGPDVVWRYGGADVNVELLEVSGKSYEVSSKHIGDIRSELLEAWGVVLTNMTDTVGRVATGNEMSGRFLELAHAPLLALVSECRDIFWSNSLEPMLQMCLRMCVELGGDGLLIPDSDKVASICRKFRNEDIGWLGPQLTPVWGRYFTPDDTEVKTSVEATAAAKEGGLISKETAARYVGQDFGVKDIDEELERIEEEAEEAEEKERARAEEELRNAHALAGRAGRDATSSAAGRGGTATASASKGQEGGQASKASGG